MTRHPSRPVDGPEGRPGLRGVRRGAAVLAVWVLAAVVQLALAYLDVRAGIRATLAAQDDLTPAAILDGRIDERLDHARARFAS